MNLSGLLLPRLSSSTSSLEWCAGEGAPLITAACKLEGKINRENDLVLRRGRHKEAPGGGGGAIRMMPGPRSPLCHIAEKFYALLKIPGWPMLGWKFFIYRGKSECFYQKVSLKIVTNRWRSGWYFFFFLFHYCSINQQCGSRTQHRAGLRVKLSTNSSGLRR